ncbi:hypothetical protein EC973_008121 [Apophysomyces ossiformis]|uniref:LAG1-DNAbind-domain-containing protein n=1 Tax=Apophysomyces ossiformis TaxID=679940 RepID=A0A8H7EPC1_9FUNG|nr:hypothetical protein EC973_008121 [Apophysomyces ossiformis]
MLTTPNFTDTTSTSRKRKQENWSEYVCTSPSSSACDLFSDVLSMDTFFPSFDQETITSGSQSRRHSVAVGEMNYHSFDNLKHEFDMLDLHQLLGTPLNNEPRRSMSLRPDSITPSSFLESLEENKSLDTCLLEQDVFSQNPVDDFLSFNLLDGLQTSSTTITPSALTEMGWLVEKNPKRHKACSPPTSPTYTMSSTSPSPPITPLQTVAPGFDSAIDDKKRQKNSMVTARMIQGATSASALKPLIQQYFHSTHTPSGDYYHGERTVMILTSKVAQKILTSKFKPHIRFLCPPPTTLLMGANWWTSSPSSASSDQSHQSLFPSRTVSPPSLTVQISGESTSQTGVLEWHSPTGILDSSSSAVAAASGDTNLSGKCVSKQLHINDADEKRKRVEVMVKIQLGNGVQLGTLASKGIKVISKPSKKRQSVKNMELCIHHGTTISLFNRIRSQTVSTKYLGVSNGPASNANACTMKSNSNNGGTCFVARTGSWDPFVIWIVDTTRCPDTTMRSPHHPTNPRFPPPPAIALQTPAHHQPVAIHYNQPVVLQCVSTGLVSPVMVIRKVDKGSMVLGGHQLSGLGRTGGGGGECGDEALGDPVSQLHKIAFQIVQDPTAVPTTVTPFPSSMTADWVLPQSSHPITYLACLNDVVGMYKTTSPRSLVSDDKRSHQRRASAPLPAKSHSASSLQRRRINSLNDLKDNNNRGHGTSAGEGGACWTEDVSDAAVWTIVGTDCATYTFWTPSADNPHGFNAPFESENASPLAPFPNLTQVTTKDTMLSLSGENFTRDLAIWFGDVKAARTDYKSREHISCVVPDTRELLESPVTRLDEDGKRRLPILFVRGDGVVYRTDRFYAF